MAFAIIFIVSAIGVAALAGLAAWARIETPQPPLDRTSALDLFAEEFPDRRVGGIWVSADGAAALARSGDEALIAYRMGDGHAARIAPWSAVETAQRRGESMRVRLGDIAAPWAAFKVGEAAAWPPQLEGAG